jgi:hypothetical protein
MFKITAFFIIILCYIWGLIFQSHVESTCMTASFHWGEDWAHATIVARHFSLKCLYKARKMSLQILDRPFFLTWYRQMAGVTLVWWSRSRDIENDKWQPYPKSNKEWCYKKMGGQVFVSVLPSMIYTLDFGIVSTVVYICLFLVFILFLYC